MSQDLSADSVTPDMVVEQLPNFLDSSKAAGVDASVLFDLSGQNAGQWWVKIHDGHAESGKGAVENPNLTLLADSQEWTKIMLGQLDPTSAFMSGRLRIKGDMGLAIKLTSMFKRPS